MANDVSQCVLYDRQSKKIEVTIIFVCALLTAGLTLGLFYGDPHSFNENATQEQKEAHLYKFIGEMIMFGVAAVICLYGAAVGCRPTLTREEEDAERGLGFWKNNLVALAPVAPPAIDVLYADEPVDALAANMHAIVPINAAAIPIPIQSGQPRLFAQSLQSATDKTSLMQSSAPHYGGMSC